MTEEKKINDILKTTWFSFKEQYVSLILATLITIFGSFLIFTLAPLIYGLYATCIKMIKGQKIEATDDHPFFVIGKGWKKTIELVVGDEIETDGFGPVRVESVIDEKRLDLTFNFTVADFHTYYVTKKNVLVHNCNIANMKKVNEKDGNKFAQEAGYKDAHEAKKGYGDSRVNLYRDKETGDIYIWDGKKDSEPQKL